MINQMAKTTLALRHVYNNGMMFQQRQPITIAGYSSVGDTVTVRLGTAETSTVTTARMWSVTLPPMDASFEPLTLTVSNDRGEQVVVTDVLIGDVWLITGQSNAAYQIDQVVDMDCRSELTEFVRDTSVRSVTTCHHPHMTETGDFCDRVTWVNGTEDVDRQGAIGIAFAKRLRDILNIPVGVVTAAWGGSAISQWIGDTTSNFVYLNTAKAWTDMRFTGCVWYQGESDRLANMDCEYATRFAALRTMFKTDFNAPDMRIFVVQLPAFAADGENGDQGWVNIRRTQEAFMDTFDDVHTVCTIDMGEHDNIHPNDKLSPARRLADAAMQIQYRDAAFFGTSARLAAASATENGCTLTFAADAPLTLSQGDTVNNLAVADADGTLYPCIGRISGPATVAVSWEPDIRVCAVQYLQIDAPPTPVNLFDQNGLPVFPFIADIYS